MYDHICARADLAADAAAVVAGLAAKYDVALDLVIENARRYAKWQHIDDAFPYEPSSLDVLGEIQAVSPKARGVLTHIASSDQGGPQSKAIQLLRKRT
jgi:hypothetical protein